MPRRPLFSLVLVGFTLLLAGLILTDWLPALRGPAPETSEWHWLYELRPQTRWWLPLLTATGLWFFALWWLQQRDWSGVGLAGLVVGSLALQLALVYAHRPQVAAELVDRTLSDATNGYFTVAANNGDMNGLLRDFPQVMPTLASEHTRTHPPGLILAQWLTIRWGAAASSLAPSVYPLRCTDLWLLNQPPATAAALLIWSFLPLVAAAFTVVPVYYLGLRLADEPAARMAALFTAALPALLIFAPTPDQIYAFLSVVTLLLWLIAIERRNALFAFLTGFLLSLSTFLSLGNGTFIVVLGVFALLHPNRQSSIVNLKWFMSFAFGLASLWLVYWLGWGVAPWQLAQIALQQHYELVTSLRRYDWWVVYNLLDLLLFAGPMVVVGFAAALLFTFRRMILPKVSTTRQILGSTLRKDTGLTLALALLILVLDLSGSARGEVGRLWLFFMPLLAIVAAKQLVSLSAFQQVSQSATQSSVLNPLFSVLIFAAQLMLVLAIGLAWKPIEAVIVVAERPQMPTTIPTHKITVPFGETIQLVGYDLDTSAAGPGGVLDVTLYWEAEVAAARPYTVFAHLINQDGELVAQKDNWPVNGQWPPTCWQASEVVVDPYTLQLPADREPGTYSLLVGLYDADTGVRLRTADGLDAFSLADELFDDLAE